MKTLVTFALSLFAVVNARSILSNEKRQSATISVTGAAGGSVQPRLEIRALAANADAYNVFLLALRNFQARPHNNDDSWFQIAGIHGMPYTAWNGAPQDPSAGNPPTIGYCTHSSPLFAVWHRPYVALVEQMFLEEVQNVVNSFQGADRTRYASAAQNMRWPTWDWALPPPSGEVLPSLFTQATVNVNTPQGQQEIPNPLYQYETFNPTGTGIFGQGTVWDQWQNTYRYPAAQTAQTTSQDSQASARLDADLTANRQAVYNLLTTCKDFTSMAADGVQDSDTSCHNSLEGIHNGIHTDVGGNGHMTYTNFAGFDPIFFMHHANVDRLFAMWQALNPNTWIQPVSQGQFGTFAIAPNTQLSGSTPLSPFWRSAGQFWTVDQVRDYQSAFNYNYPELMPAADGTQPNIAAIVNNYYGSQQIPSNVPSNPQPSSTAAPQSSSTAAAPPGSSTLAPAPQSSSSAALLAGSSTPAPAPAAQSSSSAAAAGQSSSSSSAPRPPGSSGIPGSPGSDNTTSTGGSAPGGDSSNSTAGSSSGGSSSNSTAGAPTGFTPPNASTGSLQNSTNIPHSPVTNPSPGDLGQLLTPTGRTHDYKANIVSGKNGLQGSYSIFIFLDTGKGSSNGTMASNKTSNTAVGPTSGGPMEWIKSPSYVGSKGVFASAPGVPGLHAPNQNGGNWTSKFVSGSVTLTAALVARVAAGDIHSLNETDVVPYLRTHLAWRVAKPDGTVIPNNLVPGLTVSEAHCTVEPAPDDSILPVFNQYVVDTTVTHGATGGLQKGMPEPCSGNRPTSRRFRRR